MDKAGAIMPPTTESDGKGQFDIFKRFFRNFKDSGSQDEVEELTKQFYVTLRAYFAKIKCMNGEVRNAEAFARIDQLLSDPKNESWANAYEIEQLLVHLFDEATLATELTVRTLEARSILRPELVAVYDAQAREADALPANADAAAQAKSADLRRTLLGRMVNDLQWRYIVNEASRRYSKMITKRTSYLSVAALLAFAVSTTIAFWLSVELHYGDLRLFLISGLAGAWGATFSMLATVQSRLEKSSFDALKLMRARAVLLSRALIGAGAACILFFFLLSGLLGGTAFPTLIAPGNAATQQTTPAPPTSPNLPTRDLALLVVWCFIAGFSEQLIPGLLTSTESRAMPATAAGSDRFKPEQAPPIKPAAPSEELPQSQQPTTPQVPERAPEAAKSAVGTGGQT